MRSGPDPMCRRSFASSRRHDRSSIAAAWPLRLHGLSSDARRLLSPCDMRIHLAASRLLALPRSGSRRRRSDGPPLLRSPSVPICRRTWPSRPPSSPANSSPSLAVLPLRSRDWPDRDCTWVPPRSHRPPCRRRRAAAEVTPLSPDRYKVQVTIGVETLEKLRLAKDLLRHAVPSGDEAVILDRALTALLARPRSEEVRRRADRPRPAHDGAHAGLARYPGRGQAQGVAARPGTLRVRRDTGRRCSERAIPRVPPPAALCARRRGHAREHPAALPQPQRVRGQAVVRGRQRKRGCRIRAGAGRLVRSAQHANSFRNELPQRGAARPGAMSTRGRQRVSSRGPARARSYRASRRPRRGSARASGRARRPSGTRSPRSGARSRQRRTQGGVVARQEVHRLDVLVAVPVVEGRRSSAARAPRAPPSGR